MSKKNNKEEVSVSFGGIATPSTFEKAVDTILQVDMQMTETKIKGIWIIGKIVADMQNEEGVYGTHITSRVAEALTKQGRPISKRAIEEYHRAYKTTPNLEDIEALSKLGLEWSKMRAINRIEDSEKRKQVVEQVTKVDEKTGRSMTASQTNKHVKQILEGKEDLVQIVDKQENIPKTHPTGFFLHIEDYLSNFANKLSKCSRAAKELEKELAALDIKIAENISKIVDESLVSDEEFDRAVESCKKSANIAKVLLDNVKLLEDNIASSCGDIRDRLEESFSKLDESVCYGDS